MIIRLKFGFHLHPVHFFFTTCDKQLVASDITMQILDLGAREVVQQYGWSRCFGPAR
jgi:hypothetical protein